MKLKPSTWFAIFILLLMVIIIIVSLNYERRELKLMPIIVASGVLVLSVMVLWQETKVKDRLPSAKQEGVPEGGATQGAGRRLSYTMGWIIALFLGVYLIGLLAAILLFIASYMKVNGWSWRVSLIFSAATTAILYGVFELGLKAGLYRGLIYLFLQR
ncbi:MAG: tripartite tricarboxylate transporter TctB family protein [Chloroflexota bacterium]